MADAKISALPSATTPLAGTEVVPVVQGGVTAKVPVLDLLCYSPGTNTRIGEGAGAAVTTATNLVAIGLYAAYNLTTGGDCTYVGKGSGYASVLKINTGPANSAFGAYTLGHNTTGGFNSVSGRAAGWYNATGNYNTYHGYRCGYGNTSGSSNIAMGFYAGHNTATGIRNTMLGAETDYYVPPIGAAAAAAVAGGALAVGTYTYRFTVVLDGVETAFSDFISATTAGANLQISLTSIPVYSGPKTCSARKVYRTPVGGENLSYLVTTIADNTTTTYTDNTPDGSLGAQPTQPSGSVMLGMGSQAYKSGQLVAGSSSAVITEVCIGGGVVSASPQTVTYFPSDASGTNVAGAAIRIAGGKGTGTGVGGPVQIAVALAGSAGSAGNTLVDTWLFSSTAGHLLASTDNTFDIGASGASRPRSGYFGTSLSVNGTATVGALVTGTANGILWGSNGYLLSPSNGVFKFSNGADNDFNRLQFGGTTSSYPSIKRSAARIAIRLADDTDDAAVSAAFVVLKNTTVAALPAAATAGSGAVAFVTDALTPAFGVAVTGGGAVKVPVYSDGSTWLVG